MSINLGFECLSGAPMEPPEDKVHYPKCPLHEDQEGHYDRYEDECECDAIDESNLLNSLGL